MSKKALGYGNGAPNQSQRAIAQAIFQQLLSTRTQRELAAELGIDQSRVSAGKVSGRVHVAVIERAARLAGRSEVEIASIRFEPERLVKTHASDLAVAKDECAECARAWAQVAELKERVAKLEAAIVGLAISASE